MKNKRRKKNPQKKKTSKLISFDSKNARPLDELSKGLSFGLPKEILENYTRSTEMHHDFLDNFNNLSKQISLSSKYIKDFYSKTSEPIDILRSDIGLLSAHTKQLSELGKITRKNLLITNKLSNTLLDTIQSQQKIALSGMQSINSLTELKKFITNSNSSFQMLVSGAESTIQSMPTFPPLRDFPIMEKARLDSLPTTQETKEKQEELDELLRELNPDLVIIRLGVWENFNQKGKDYIRQSSSSMRGLVDKVLRIIGPTEEVVKTDYFKTKDGHTNKGKPTRISRIYYAIGYDKEPSKDFKGLAKGLKGLLEAHKMLDHWDHEPIDIDGFVCGNFISTEGYIFSLLSARKRNIVRQES